MTDLSDKCELLRSLHRPGDPLVLPNAWDAATAAAVVEAGFPVVATSSAAIAPTLGYADHHGAPAAEMLAAAGRIAAAVDVPVSVDAEGGYGMEPAELVDELRRIGAAGFNLEDTDHADEALRDPAEHARWLAAVRAAAEERGYRPVINARIDVFLAAAISGAPEGGQAELVDAALERARAYAAAGADCVYPIGLREPDAVRAFLAAAPGPVNLLALPDGPSVDELAELGVARISYASLLYREAIEGFRAALSELRR